MHENQQTTELIQKYLNQSSSESELGALEELLIHDAQAAEALADAVRMEAGLTRIFRAEGRTAEVLAQVAGAQQHSVGRLSLRERTAFRGAKSDKRAWQIAAAVLLVAGTVALLYRFTHPFANPRAAPQPAAAAWNQVVSGDVLINGARGQAVHDGASLQVLGDSSAVVRLTDGSQAEFEPGATALIHGRVAGLRQWVELNEGSGTFRVEKAAGEFQVATPMGSVTALDTEFSVGIQTASLPGEVLMKLPTAMLVVAVLSGVAQVEFGDQTYPLQAGESRVFAQEQDQPGPAVAESGNAAPASPRRVATIPTPGTRRGQAANNVRGPILSIDKAKVTLGSRIRQTEFDVGEGAHLTIDGKPAAIEQFSQGMVVVLERKDGQGPVLSINAEGSTIGGSLKSVDDEGRTITISTTGGDAGSEQTYALADDVSITLDGQAAWLSDIPLSTSVALKLSVDQKTVIAVTRRSRPRRGS